MEIFVGRNPSMPTNERSLLLVASDWDDYSYRTSFQLWVIEPDGAQHHIGQVKILAAEYPPPRASGLSITVSQLSTSQRAPLDPSQYCSLGQSSDYYHALAELGPDTARLVLTALNDICFSPIAPWWKTQQGLFSSLLRVNSAHIAQLDAKRIIDGKPIAREEQHQIEFTHHPPTGNNVQLTFVFDGGLPIPGRLNVIVGRNGAGKTTLLEALASWLALGPQVADFGYRPEFSKVVVVSFNPHERSEPIGARRTVGNIRHIGSRPPSRELARFAKRLDTMKELSDDAWARELLAIFPNAEAMDAALPKPTGDGRGRQLLDELRERRDWREFAATAFVGLDAPLAHALISKGSSAIDDMSPGQRILAELYASLFNEVERQSLVMIDEPENHLHPSLVAQFARTFNQLLENRKAYAIISTHSPVIVQETPSRFVTILERGDGTLATSSPPFETFGESIENLTSYLFDTDFRSSHWKSVVRALAEDGASLDDIESAVGKHQLPLLAASYASFHVNKRSGG